MLNISAVKRPKSMRFRKETDLYALQAGAQCPVMLQRGAILLDSVTGKRFLQLKLSNAGEREIKSVYLKLDCIDDTGERAGETIDAAYLDVNCKKDGCFGDKVLSQVSSVARKCLIREVRVAYADGTSERFDQDGFFNIPEAKPLETAVPAEYHRVIATLKDLRVQPENVAEGISRCICGGLITGDGKCANCGRDFKQAMYDAAHIEELCKKHELAERKRREKEEQRVRSEKSEKVLSVLGFVLGVLLILNAAFSAFVYYSSDFSKSLLLLCACVVLDAIAIIRQKNNILLYGLCVSAVVDLWFFLDFVKEIDYHPFNPFNYCFVFLASAIVWGALLIGTLFITHRWKIQKTIIFSMVAAVSAVCSIWAELTMLPPWAKLTMLPPVEAVVIVVVYIIFRNKIAELLICVYIVAFAYFKNCKVASEDGPANVAINIKQAFGDVQTKLIRVSDQSAKRVVGAQPTDWIAVLLNHAADKMDGSEAKSRRSKLSIASRVVSLLAVIMLPMNLVSCGSDSYYSGFECIKHGFTFPYWSGSYAGGIVLLLLVLICLEVAVLSGRKFARRRNAIVLDLQKLISVFGIFMFIYYSTNKSYEILFGGYIMTLAYVLQYPVGLMYCASGLAVSSERLPEKTSDMFLSEKTVRRVLLAVHVVLFVFVFHGDYHFVWRMIGYLAVIIEIEASLGQKLAKRLFALMLALETVALVMMLFMFKTTVKEIPLTFVLSLLILAASGLAYVLFLGGKKALGRKKERRSEPMSRRS
ncbi:hypothetical protein SAMN04487771_101946 [[Clostridium] aminophilum]|uniref:Uncharacterized protein n=2 Tax=[Clostridium] aminophilum TaxID=1526 RepID=A0A1I0EMA5_9FIRM|nr:hypothetical protein SAMN04487771_101946 [[Clostridium] aminophilum]